LVELVDVSAMVEKIRNHRFDGYTDTGIATEIEKFKSGDGIGSIGTAVEALRSVSGALAETDVTLRRELSKMGVEWQSQAGGQAGQVFTDQAGFSRDAVDKVDHSAEMIFAQGEAFNRTLYKLPDAGTVRKGAGGLTLGDKALSLIGFETDHVREVVAAQNARAQAVEALNAYAVQSSENLSSVESMAAPEGLMLNSSDPGPSALQLAGSAVDLTPGGDKGETPGDTRAAAAGGPATGPVSQPAAKPNVAVPQYDVPTPAMGIQAPSRSGGGASAPPPPPPSESTTPSGSIPHAPGGTSGSVAVPPRNPGYPEPGRPIAPGSPGTPGAPGTPALPGVPGVSGPSVGSVLGGQAPGSGSTGSENPAGRFGSGAEGSRTGFPGGAGVITGGGDQSLGKGKLVGAGPQTPTAPAEVGRPFPPLPKPGIGAGDLGAGATALGAGAVGGATSGERERQGRGVGRGVVSSGKQLGQLPMGELPEEEAAAQRNSEKLSPRKEKGNASFMERAAPQNPQDEDDAEHVRRFGVDDKDLFADPRMVSPDLIGDNGADETR
jgi:hypothetical protein